MEWNRIKVEIGTVDFTAWLANEEQVATLPNGPEVGRATFSLLDTGTLPAVTEWQALTLYGGGTAATVPIWAGYVTRIGQEPFNETGGTARLVTLDCQSAAVRLLTTEPITAQYGGGDYDYITTDRDVVSHLVNTYLPEFHNSAKIGTADQVQIDYIAFENENLRSALNKVSQRTGRTFGVDAVPEFWYRQKDETGFATPYQYVLTDAPNWDEVDYVPMTVKPYYDRDAVDLRNKVRVVGGWTLSDVQEETFAGDDATLLFTLAARPDVIVSVVYANLAQTVGLMYVDDPADFDCLVNYDRQYILFDTAPESGKDVVVRYRYRTRVDVTVENAASVAAIGTLWAPTVEDASISSAAQGSALGSAYLAAGVVVERVQATTRFSGGTAGTVTPWEPGRLVALTTAAFAWDEEQFSLHAVTMRARPMPGGDGVSVVEWDLDLGRSPATVGQVYGGNWNNTAVLPRQHAPDVTEAMAEASGGGGVTDHGALTGLTDDDHTGYLLATGARTGASSQAQTFTNGIIGPTWKPVSDSTTALQVQQAGGTAIVTVDTTNSRIGIGKTPSWALDVSGAICANDVIALNYRDASVNTIFTSAGGYTNFPGVVGFTKDGYSIEIGQAFVGYFMSAHVGIQPTTATAKALGIRAHASQSANLVQWESSNGATVYGCLDATGRLGLGASAPDSIIHATLDDAATNAASQLLTLSHNTSGTVANGFGSRVLWELESSTSADQSAAALDVVWAEKTHGSRAARVLLYAYDTAAREGLRIEASGSAPLIGFLGASAAARQAHVADPSGGATVDAEARTAINAILATLETFGLHATS